jgi:hypothetical protein
LRRLSLCERRLLASFGCRLPGEYATGGEADLSLSRCSLDERTRNHLFERAGRAFQLNAVIALEQRQHFLTRHAE